MKYKGIILAGGNGTRLYPLTTSVSKQLLPVYDKPMIHYSVAQMLEFGIDEILIITSSYENVSLYSKLLSDVNAYFTYVVQNTPCGIANAFHLGEHFIGGDNVCLMLGDNIFYGNFSLVTDAIKNTTRNLILGIEVANPKSYGVMSFNKNCVLEKIVEKPEIPPSNYAVPGIYFFDNTVIDKAKKLIPSKRGEYEITDVINQYIDEEKMCHVLMHSESMTWFDCGQIDDLLEASNFIAAVQKRTGKKVGDVYAKRIKQ